MTKPDFAVLSEQIKKLNREEQLLLIEQIVVALRNSPDESQAAQSEDIETWDDDELQQLLNDNHPLTTQEIVAAGLFGGWEDMRIEDSLSWVQAQRAKTKGRYSW